MNAKTLMKLALPLLVAGAIATFVALGGQEYLSLDSLQARRDELLIYAQRNYVGMLFAYGVLYTAAVAFSLPGATVLSLAAGLLFGRWVGAVLIVLSASLGATLLFLGARYVFGEGVRRRLEKNALTGRVIAGFREDAFHYLLFLRLVPLFPFWLVNLAPAFTGIRLRTYVSATALGILAGSFVFANLGQSLGRIDSLAGLLSGEVLFAFALLGLMALAPVGLRRRRAAVAAYSPVVEISTSRVAKGRRSGNQ